MDATLYMACLILKDQPVLVVGGGPIATAKAESLLAAGAIVEVVAPRVSAGMRKLIEAEKLSWIERGYESQDLDGKLLVVAATDDPQLHARLHAEATARPMLVNVVDVPDLCSFIVPAIHRQGPITFAVSTAGASPALAKRMRDLITETFGPAWGILADRLRQERPWSRENLGSYLDRQRFFESIVLGDPDPIALIEDGDPDALDRLILLRREQAQSS